MMAVQLSPSGSAEEKYKNDGWTMGSSPKYKFEQDIGLLGR